MDVKLLTSSSLLMAMLFSLYEVSDAIDPYYIPKAKIYSRKEIAVPNRESFAPSARKCKKLGERAAKKSLSCVASVNFYDSMINRVHMSRNVLNRNIVELKSLATKISKCSRKYSRYYEKACSMKATYFNDRRRCRLLTTRRERTVCKGEIRRRYSR